MLLRQRRVAQAVVPARKEKGEVCYHSQQNKHRKSQQTAKTCQNLEYGIGYWTEQEGQEQSHRFVAGDRQRVAPRIDANIGEVCLLKKVLQARWCVTPVIIGN